MRFVLIGILAAAIAAVGGAATADPALFAARDADTTLYLFGTIHYAPCAGATLASEIERIETDFLATDPALDCTDWMSDQLATALASADEVWVEVADIADQAAIAPILTELGMFGDARLSDYIPAAEIAEIVAVLSPLVGQVNPAALDRMQPWLVALLLGQAGIVDTDVSITEGVDLAVIRMVGELGIPVRGFETADQQVRMLAADPLELQVADLRASLVFYRHAVDLAGLSRTAFDEMWDFWLAGDVDSLAALFLADEEALIEELGLAAVAKALGVSETTLKAIDVETDRLYDGLIDPEERMAQQYERLLAERNRTWLTDIRALLARPGTFFIAVGAAHLTGATALQTLLAQEGVEVTRVQ